MPELQHGFVCLLQGTESETAGSGLKAGCKSWISIILRMVHRSEPLILRPNQPLMPKVPFWIFIVLALLHLSAIRVDIMDIDASQYAEISREMAGSGQYLQVFDRGRDYLDKPPLLFWASATTIKLFGATNLGYKLPSILLALWGIYATYRLGRRLYDEATGRMAALILGSCQAMFLMTNDVRTDTMLMSWVVTAIWMIREAELQRRWYWVLGGTFAIACGMMSKGPIALLVPLFCFGTDWLLRREWKQILNPRHLLDLALIGIFLIPMSIGLYQQYDMQPEKWIDGKQGTSGLHFFYWSQSFGRITGESPWDNGAPFTFLLENMLWSFLPWIFLFLPALVLAVLRVIQQHFRLRPGQEAVTLGGFVLAYIALGSSRYQLPHYIFVVFPLAAIMTARLLHDIFNGRYARLKRFMKPFMAVVGALLWIGVLLVLTYVFPAGWTAVLLWALGTGIWLWVALRRGLRGKLLWIPAVASIGVNVFLTHHFYYRLMDYQMGSVAGRFISSQPWGQTGRLMTYRVDDPLNSLHFYARQVVPVFEKGKLKAQSGDYVLTMEEGASELLQQGFQADTLMQGRQFRVSLLTPQFLNPDMRRQATRPYYLLQLK
jgi:4-amino-4-deoxy-L-arabinose transferase-like glycosyltransferase